MPGYIQEDPSLARVLDVEARTRTKVISFTRHGKPAVDVDLTRLVVGISDHHVKIMRGELATILHYATRDDVEYVFAEGIRRLTQHNDGVDSEFEHATARRFDLVIGADGLHSAVRRLTFGDESQFCRYLGGYLAVFTVVPNHVQLHGRMLTSSTRQARRHLPRPPIRTGPRGVPVPPQHRVRQHRL
jgi:2-polyprenyl-6-methoxyphenol hydroxylase-like FAD-dependent oxidoreductase